MGKRRRTDAESYGVDDPIDLPGEHIDWIRTLPLTTREHGRLFVHAGIRPNVPIAYQSEEDLLWIREPFLSSNDDHSDFSSYMEHTKPIAEA